MPPDSQSIASFEIFGSASTVDKTPQRDRRRIVSRMKKVYAERQAHLYIWAFLLLGRKILSRRTRRIMYRIKMPKVIPNRASSPIPLINDGEYMLLAVTTRQKGTIIDRAIIFLSLLSFTLLNRLILSFQRIRLASREGKISIVLLSRQMMTSNESKVSMSQIGEVISVASLCSVTHIFQKGSHSVSEISLNRYLSVFCASAHTAFYLEGAAKFGKVVRSSNEACDERNLLSSTTFSVDGDYEVLL